MFRLLRLVAAMVSLLLLVAFYLTERGIFGPADPDRAYTALRTRIAGKAGPRRLIAGERKTCSLPAPGMDLPDPPTTAAIMGATSFFAARHFRENISPGAEVRIAWLGATFMRRFAVKIEAADGDSAIRFHTVLQSSRDGQIVDVLEGRHETRLTDVWCLLKAQPNGEPGPLLTDAVPNIFYVRDGAGTLGVVDVVWGGAGWEIGASPADGVRVWPAGVRVIAR